MNGLSRAFRPVIEQRQLAALQLARKTVTQLTVQIKEMEAAGFAVEPGPLNFMKGKILSHSPVRELLPVTQIESFDRIARLLSADDARAVRGHRIVLATWRRLRSEIFAELLVQYRTDVFELHSELAQRGSLAPAAAWWDRAVLNFWLAEMRLAGLAFSRGILSSGHVASSAAAQIMGKLIERGFVPASA
jgi:hypothetical protein